MRMLLFLAMKKSKRAFLQVVSILNLQSSGYAVPTFRENMDEVLRQQGSGTLPSKYLYIIQIHVNSGYEGNSLSFVAMLIFYAYLNALSKCFTNQLISQLTN